MRRRTLLSACTTFRKALGESGLTDLFNECRDNPADIVKNRADRLMAGVLKYGQTAEGFDPPTRELVKIFDFEFISSPKWIVSLFSGDEKTVTKNLFNFIFSMTLVESYLPKFADLVRADPAARLFEEALRNGSAAGRHKPLSVIVIEEENEISSAERIISILQAVQDLYGAACRLAGVQEDTCLTR